MHRTDKFIINRLTWKARQYNLPTKFAFFSTDLPQKLQTYLNSQVDKEKSGTPVLFFTKLTKEWTLVCTQQVVCNDNEKTFLINIGDIKQILPTTFDPTLVGQHITVDISMKKTEWETIKIIDREGNFHILHADAGKDLFSLWNILLMAVRIYH